MTAFGQRVRCGAAAWVLALLLPGLAACGYHLAGRGAVLPAGTRVVAVLPFANHTRQPQIGQALGAAVAQEFQERTRYRIQPAVAGSDVAVHGDVRSLVDTPVTFDAATGRATTVEVVMHVQVWLTAEPGGHELYRNNDLVFHEQYQISTEQQNFFEENSSAFQRLSREAAQTVVANILEAF